jgi:hypothetical protein
MSLPQTIVDVKVKTQGGMGTSDYKSLAQQFSASPITGQHAEVAPHGDPLEIQHMNDAAVKTTFAVFVMNGVVEDGAYWGFPIPFNLNFQGPAIDLDDGAPLAPPAYDFQWQKAGDPINSFVPNLMSSPNADPLQQPKPGPKMTEWANDDGNKGSSPFMGPGTAVSPQKTTFDQLYGTNDTGWSVIPGTDPKDVSSELLGNYMPGYAGGVPKSGEPSPDQLVGDIT